MKISAKCGACGSTLLVIPDDNEEDQMIRCAKCSKDVGDKAVVSAKLHEAAKREADKLVSEMQKRLDKAFKKR